MKENSISGWKLNLHKDDKNVNMQLLASTNWRILTLRRCLEEELAAAAAWKNVESDKKYGIICKVSNKMRKSYSMWSRTTFCAIQTQTFYIKSSAWTFLVCSQRDFWVWCSNDDMINWGRRKISLKTAKSKISTKQLSWYCCKYLSYKIANLPFQVFLSASLSILFLSFPLEVLEAWVVWVVF